MENEEFYTILTNVGKAQIANAIALNTPIDIVKFHVGDGGGEYYNPTEEQTELKNKVWECSVNSVRVDENNPNWIVLEVVIPGDVGGFTIREVGAFDSEDNLIAIGKFPQTYKPHPTDGSLKELILKMVLEVSNTSCVVLKVDPTVILATKKDIEELSNRIDKLENRLNNLKLVDTKVEFTDPDDKFGFGKKTHINKAIMKLADEIKKVLQSGVNIKNNVISVINSKLSVGDLPFSAGWNEIIEAIRNIKEGRGNAKPEHVLKPYTYTDDSGVMKTGAMPDRGGARTITPSTTNHVLQAGYYSGDITVPGSVYLVPNNIVQGINVFGVLGTALRATGNAQPSQVLEGIKFSTENGNNLTGTMPNRGGARTIIPSTKDQVIPWGFNSGDVTVKGSNTLKAEYIKYGINIFGVIGTLETGYTGSVKEAKTINLSNNYSLSFTYNLYNKRPITIRITPTSTFKTSQDSKYTFNQYVGVIKPYVNSYSIYFHADLIFTVYYYEDNRNDTIDITFTGGGHTNPTGSLKVEFIQ